MRLVGHVIGGLMTLTLYKDYDKYGNLVLWPAKFNYN